MGMVKDHILKAVEFGRKVGRTDGTPVYHNNKLNQQFLGVHLFPESCSGHAGAPYILSFEESGQLLFTDNPCYPDTNPLGELAIGEVWDFGTITFPDSAQYEFWRQHERGQNVAGEWREKGFYFRFIGKPEGGPLHWVTPGDPDEYTALLTDVEGPFPTYQALFEAINHQREK